MKIYVVCFALIRVYLLEFLQEIFWEESFQNLRGANRHKLSCMSEFPKILPFLDVLLKDIDLPSKV